VSAQQYERPAAPTIRRVPDRPQVERPAPVTLIPAEVVRISAMSSELLQEARQVTLDEPGRRRLAATYQTSTRELARLLPAKLAAELDRFALPFTRQPPTQAELRVAQAQLVGWLDGLFGGIQMAVLTQQMAAERRLAERRRPGAPQATGDPDSDSYL
jgi:Bacterial proteasome activator